MRHRTKLLVGGAVAIVLLAGGLLGGVFAESPSAGPTGVGSAQAISESALSGIAQGGTEATITRLEAALASAPRNTEALSSLGLAYQVRWRETGDAGFLPRSEAALKRALRTSGEDPTATLGLGNLALIRHEFRQALVIGRRAHNLAPYAARPYGVMGDAQIELGHYDAAFTTFEKMVSVRPTLASYARVAYARELTGDREGAIDAMELALDAAGGQPEPTAWSQVEIGKLELGRDRLETAERRFQAALAIDPGYVYALEQMARVEAARGNLAPAIVYARRASDAIPLPQFVALLGDLLERRGDTVAARRQQATVGAIDKLLVANGVRVDLESAVYRADHGVAPKQTVSLARKARADRPSVYGDDALGWALARAGQCREAVRWSQRSLRLGTEDALLWFHRGYAAGCAGDKAGMRTWYMRALALNPHFSIRFAPLARKALS
jgi:tetratricopeptide (TPR) repeat protein